VEIKINSKKSLLQLLELAPRKLRTRMVFESLMMVLVSVMEILIMLIVVPLISVLTAGTTNSKIFDELFALLNTDSEDKKLMILCISLLLMCGLKLFLSSLATYSQIQFSRLFEESISRSLLASIISQPYEFHLEENSSTLINQVSNEVDQVKKTLISLFAAFAELIIVVALLTFIIVFNPLASIGSVSIIVLSGATFLGLTKNKLIHLGLKINRESAVANKHLTQSLHGIKEIKIRSLNNFFVDQYILSSKIYKQTEGSYLFISRLPAIAFEIIAILGLMTSIFILFLTNTDHADITQSLGILVAVSFRLIPSGNRILIGMNDLKYSRTSINSIAEMISKAKQNCDVHLVEQFENEIRFTNVNYAFSDIESPVVQNLSFTIARGERIGIIGESGSGKSTVLDLILGLVNPKTGSISIDDVQFDCSRMAWGKVIGYVAQDIYLADDTLRNNIAFGIDPLKISDVRIDTCLEISHLSRFAHEAPDGLDQILGEHGSKISGGEKQRIGIARCIYQDPEIIVLDEATSALDSETEQIVMNNLFNHQPKKTFIVVAHRLATIAKCDKVLQINKGSVARILIGEEIAAFISETNNL